MEPPPRPAAKIVTSALMGGRSVRNINTRHCLFHNSLKSAEMAVTLNGTGIAHYDSDLPFLSKSGLTTSPT
eukprot:498841-Pelagomonas_calceolata.AAC.1